MGSAWHGIREHIFDYARQNFHSSFSEEQKACFIDFIDKGGAESVLIALKTVTNNNEFQQEAMNRIDSDAADDIVQLIYAVSYPHISSLSKEAIQQAISQALEHPMNKTFTEASSSMAEALLPIQYLINSVIQGPLEVPCDGESARKFVSFVISAEGERYVRQRCLTMTERFGKSLSSSCLCCVR